MPCTTRYLLVLFEGAGYFAELQVVAIINRCRGVGHQALAVDTRSIGAVEVGQGILVTSMLEGRMDPRDGVGGIKSAEINGWLLSTQIMIIATNHSFCTT